MPRVEVVAFIPARLGSSRLSRKVLREIKGRPLLFHVWSRVNRAKTVDRVVIATDTPEIKRVAETFGAEVVMTSKRHRTGTDRIAEAAKKVGGDILINVQGDNFGVSAPVLDRVVTAMKKRRTIECATLIRRIQSDDDLFDPSMVKVIKDKAGQALWFSRYPLPYLFKADQEDRSGQHEFWGHIGIYFFRASLLKKFAKWGRSKLERAESLEQLRILENGGRIDVFKTTMKSISIDTENDLTRATSS